MNTENAVAVLLKRIADLFTKEMRFTQCFNMEIKHFDTQKIIIRFAMHEALQGNMMHHMLHGGATATILDSAGGMVAMAAFCSKHVNLPQKEQLEKMSKIGTVDLRVDYIRPGQGEFFIVEANVLRAGNKISVIQSTLVNDQKKLIAAGMATYLLS